MGGILASPGLAKSPIGGVKMKNVNTGETNTLSEEFDKNSELSNRNIGSSKFLTSNLTPKSTGKKTSLG